MAYNEGFYEALAIANQSNRDEMLDWLDGLQGTDNLSIRASDSDIREELKRQIREDFHIPEHDDLYVHLIVTSKKS